MYWIGFYKYPEKFLGVEYDKDKSKHLALWEQVGQSACWWWAFEDVVVISERPTEIHVEPVRNGAKEVRLHNAYGPSMVFADGFSVYAWHGVTVNEKIIKGEYVAQDALKERNAEVKRAMIERLGADTFFAQANPEVIHNDVDGHDNKRELVRIAIQEADAGYIQAVHVICPSTGRHYYLSVPPSVKTCQEAVASTFGLTAKQYAPEIER